MKNIRWVRTFLAIVCVLTAIFCCVCAEAEPTVIAEGPCGSNANWKLTDDGRLSIYGKGSINYAAWNRYQDDIFSLEIASGIDAIESHVFANLDGLYSATLPNTLKVINDYAFYSCDSIESIIIPDGTGRIGAHAFDGCWNLRDITVPESCGDIAPADFAPIPRGATMHCVCLSRAFAYANECEMDCVVTHAVKNGVCTRCHQKIKEEDVPETGDTAHPVLWSVMIVLSLAGILTLIKRREQVR